MEFILKNICTNKVTIPIISNLYEETNNYVEEENLFNSIENIIDVYQNYKNKSYNPTITTAASNNNYIVSKVNSCEKKIVLNNQSKEKDIIFNNFDTLFLCILEIIEPAVSLLNGISKIEKIKNFKNMMNLNLDMIKFKVSREDMKKAIENNNIIVCIYFSFLIKKSIVILKDNDYEIYGVCDDCICIVYDENEQIYKIYDENATGPLLFFIELMINKRLKTYIENDCIEKLNTYLLKDLKDIADRLKILTYKLENNKKKNYLKNELKDIINKKLEEYKY
jgi:hypothetical protein